MKAFSRPGLRAAVVLRSPLESASQATRRARLLVGWFGGGFGFLLAGLGMARLVGICLVVGSGTCKEIVTSGRCFLLSSSSCSEFGCIAVGRAIFVLAIVAATARSHRTSGWSSSLATASLPGLDIAGPVRYKHKYLQPTPQRNGSIRTMVVTGRLSPDTVSKRYQGNEPYWWARSVVGGSAQMFRSSTVLVFHPVYCSASVPQ